MVSILTIRRRLLHLGLQEELDSQARPEPVCAPVTWRHPWETKMSDHSTTLTLANIVYIAMEIVIGLCAIVGNVLVVWVVKLNPSLQTTTFYFIVSLALADIAVGVLVMPLAVAISLGIRVHFYSCLLMTCLLLVFTHASIMFLLAIAVDRYLRVKLTVR